MRVLVLFATLVAGTVSLSGQSVPVAEIRDPESYEVYSAVFRLDQDAKGLTSIYLRDTTTPFRDCFSTPDALPAEWKTVLNDYREKNRQPARLIEGIDVLPPYVLVGPEMMDGIRQLWNNWSTQRDATGEGAGPRPAPSAVFSVSAVGFDREKRRAMVYLGHSCGASCAEGRLRPMEKRDGEWVVSRTVSICLWLAD